MDAETKEHVTKAYELLAESARILEALRLAVSNLQARVAELEKLHSEKAKAE